jgi:hypothetical protein
LTDVRPPVDPMNDVSWARVERGLWARLDGTNTTQVAAPRSKRWLWIALPSVAVAGAIAATFAFVVDTPAPEAPIAVTPVPDESPTRVVSGSAPSTVTLGEAHITLEAESAVVVSPRDTTTTAVLERGTAKFAIAPRAGKQFVVVAGDTVVRVVGTVFTVARSEEHAVVEVERGLVDVTFQGTTMKVGAGQTWSSDHPATVGSAKTAADESKTIEAESKTIEVATKHDKAKHVTRTHADGKAPPPAVALADDDRSKYERYVALETKDPKTALAGYLEISRGTGAWAPVALYAAGRLAADRGDARAKTLLDIYLRRFPRGANADDARQLLDRLKGAP